MAGYQKDNRNYSDRIQVPILALTAEQISGLAESTRREGFLPFDAAEIEMIRDLCPNAFFPDFRRFIYRASGLLLNPLYNEIHMEYKYSKDQPKATFVIHIDGYRKIANSTGQFGGFKQNLGEDIQGKFVDTLIWRKDAQHPFEARVYFNEFLGGGDLYGSKPFHMVSKCGAALCFKIAFPVSGLSSEDEVEAWIDPAPQGPRETPSLAQGGYAVGEKATTTLEPVTAAAVLGQTLQPTTQTPVTQQPDPEAEKARLKELWVAIKNRLVAFGLTKGDLDSYHTKYYAAKAITGRPTPQQGVEALENAEQWIKDEGIDAFLKAVREEAQPAAEAWATDPAVQDALKGVGTQFPAWSPELTRIAALWCADQLREADQLDAFLINSGLNAQALPGKLESFLAITRHMAISAAPGVHKFVEREGLTLSQLEMDLSKAVGQDIRYAMDIPRNAVYQAFTAINARGKAA